MVPLQRAALRHAPSPLRLINRHTAAILADRLELALSPFERMRGLLGRDHLAENQALLLMPCRSVHTWFMRFPIDIAFVDKDGLIVAVVRQLKPWSATPYISRARATVELAAGRLRATATEVGHTLEFAAVR
ncbi:MAG: DUF192 domain-containing protein [Deltaproteobacteria bacterium]|nr:DUF192 domain-containing protein [Deltaproteobacteria bacterium]